MLHAQVELGLNVYVFQDIVWGMMDVKHVHLAFIRQSMDLKHVGHVTRQGVVTIQMNGVPLHAKLVKKAFIL